MKDGVFEVLSPGDAFRFRFFMHWFSEWPVLFGKERGGNFFALSCWPYDQQEKQREHVRMVDCIFVLSEIKTDEQKAGNRKCQNKFGAF